MQFLNPKVSDFRKATEDATATSKPGINDIREWRAPEAGVTRVMRTTRFTTQQAQ
jgi:hypothetical protein